MSAKHKQVWVNDRELIVSFHPIAHSRIVEKEEALFWDWLISLTDTGYRIM